MAVRSLENESSKKELGLVPQDQALAQGELRVVNVEPIRPASLALLGVETVEHFRDIATISISEPGARPPLLGRSLRRLQELHQKSPLLR